jgi:hypothetical protein
LGVHHHQYPHHIINIIIMAPVPAAQVILYYFHRMPTSPRDLLAHEDKMALSRLLNKTPDKISAGVCAPFPQVSGSAGDPPNRHIGFSKGFRLGQTSLL